MVSPLVQLVSVFAYFLKRVNPNPNLLGSLGIVIFLQCLSDAIRMTFDLHLGISVHTSRTDVLIVSVAPQAFHRGQSPGGQNRKLFSKQLWRANYVYTQQSLKLHGRFPLLSQEARPVWFTSKDCQNSCCFYITNWNTLSVSLASDPKQENHWGDHIIACRDFGKHG